VYDFEERMIHRHNGWKEYVPFPATEDWNELGKVFPLVRRTETVSDMTKEKVVVKPPHSLHPTNLSIGSLFS